MKETKKQLFIRGMKDGIPIGLGYFAVSFTLNVPFYGVGKSRKHAVDYGVPDTATHMKAEVDRQKKRQRGADQGRQKLPPRVCCNSADADIREREKDKKSCENIYAAA